MLQNKKLLILIGLFTALLILTLLFFFFDTMKSNPKQHLVPTPTEKPLPTVVTNTTPAQGQQPTQPVDFTGVSSSGNDLPPDQQKQVNQAFDLRQKLPVKQTDFTITYDYEADHFIVSLQQPTSESKKTFDVWLTANGFESIPTANFQFQSL